MKRTKELYEMKDAFHEEYAWLKEVIEMVAWNEEQSLEMVDRNIVVWVEDGLIAYVKEWKILRNSNEIKEMQVVLTMDELQAPMLSTMLWSDFLVRLLSSGKHLQEVTGELEVILRTRAEYIKMQEKTEDGMWLKFLFSTRGIPRMIHKEFRQLEHSKEGFMKCHETLKDMYLHKNEKTIEGVICIETLVGTKNIPNIYVKKNGTTMSLYQTPMKELVYMSLEIDSLLQEDIDWLLVWFFMYKLYPVRVKRLVHTALLT